MSKILKAGLLILTLVIPALIFTFLRFFGTNHYDLPRFHPVLTGAGLPSAAEGDTVFYHPDLNGLMGADSGDVFKGRFTVLAQFPEVCGDSCESERAQLERVYNLASIIDNLQLITFHKADTDASEGNKVKWSQVYLKDDREWTALTGKLKFETTVPEFEEVSPRYKLVLVDSDGVIRGYYAGANASEADRLMAEIRILDYERKNRK